MLLKAITWAVAVALTSATFAVWSASPVHACDCAGGTPTSYIAGADTVFIGRAGKSTTTGNKTAQMYEVFVPIKGKLGASFVVTRPANVISGCDVRHNAGDYVLLLATKGNVSLCGGNSRLVYQLKHSFADYLRHGVKGKPGKPTLRAFEVAFGATLRPYLHKRKRIHVVYAPLAGKSVRVETTRFEFTKKAPKKGVKLVVKEALRRDRVSFFDLRFAAEGLVVQTLLGDGKKGPAVWDKSVVER